MFPVFVGGRCVNKLKCPSQMMLYYMVIPMIYDWFPEDLFIIDKEEGSWKT